MGPAGRIGGVAVSVKTAIPLSFGIEVFSDELISELDPLITSHWVEVGDASRPPLVVWTLYRRAEGMNMIKVFTARDAGVLVGYGIFAIVPNIHHGGEIEAVQDVFFMSKKYRIGSSGIRFLRFCDEALKDLGVTGIRHQVTPANDWGNVLRYLGYEETQTCFERRV